MRLTITFFLGFFLVFGLHSQTICTKVITIKPILMTESKKILLTPAVFELKTKDFIIKDGFWDVQIKNGLPCKVWMEPVTVQITEQVETQPAVYREIFIQRRVRDGDIKVVETDCQ
jgi:hypothetical protein